MHLRSLPLIAVCAALLGGCASDPETRTPTGPLYSLRTVAAVAPVADVTVVAAALPPAGQPAGPPPVGDPNMTVVQAGPDGVRVFTIQVRVVRRGETPEVISAPQLTVWPYQRANISIVNQVAFIQDFDVEVAEEQLIADPIVGILQDGLTLDLVTAPVAGTDRAVDVAFKLLVAELQRPIRQRTVRFAPQALDGTIQLPRMALNSVTGVRRLGIGQEVLVGTLPDAGHGAAVDVHMRVVSSVLPAESETAGLDRGAEDFVGLDLSETMTGGDGDDGGADLKAMLATSTARNQTAGRLVLEPVTVLADLPLGVALTEATLRDRRTLLLDTPALGVHTTPVAGAEVFALLQESYVSDYEVQTGRTAGALADPVIDTFRSGITATVLADENVRIEWTTTPAVDLFDLDVLDGLTATIDVPERLVHTVTVPLRAGRQLVPIARTPEGATAAVWVSFVAE